MCAKLDVVIPVWFKIFIFFSLGLVSAYYGYWFLGFVVTAFLLIIACSYKEFTFPILKVCLIMLAAALYFCIFTEQIPSDLPSYQNVQISGKVITYPRYDDKKCSFVLANDKSIPYQRKVQVFTYFSPSIHKGDKIILKGSLKAPKKPGNPGEFDYSTFLKKEGINYILTVKKPQDFKFVCHQQGLLNWISSYRMKGEQMVHDVLDENEASILLGMVLGQKAGIDSERYGDFQKIGIVHLFAVSGLHVGFLVLLCTWVISFFSLSPRTKLLVCISVMLIYGSMVGWPVSVQRAVLMVSLVLLAYYSGRENQLLNSLGLAGIIILLFDPYALFKISFQLSFLATWGLIYLYPVLKKRIGYQNKIYDLILIPFCAQIATLPLIAYYFNLITPLGILSNVAVTYLAGAAVMLGFLAFIFSGLPPFISTVCLYPAGLFINLILAISDFIVKLPGAYLWAATPPVILIIIYYVGLLALISSIGWGECRYYQVSGIILISLLFICLILPPGIYNRGVMETVFIDVGQGDSILIKTPEGKFILIDGGGSEFSNVGSRKVLPYLRYRGIRELFMVINTHPDTDHLQGLNTVVREIKVQFIGVPASLFNAEEYEILKGIARDKKIPVIPLQKSQELNIEKDFSFKILYPNGEEKLNTHDFNNESVVIHSRYGDFSVLLTGDLEIAGLKEIVGDKNFVSATIVKVPHHGSRDGVLPEFYDKVNAKWAIISVGKNNFGHPHPILLDYLRNKHINVLRTDKNGAITIYSDGRNLKIITNN